MSKIRLYTLYSGSKGNASYVRCGSTAILIDGGKSARTLESALSLVGGNMREISAVFVTHEHADHISALEIISKKYHIPVHMTEASAVKGVPPTSHLSSVVRLHPPIYSENVGELTVTSFLLSHDSNMCVGYRIDSEDDSVGILTDTGYISESALAALSGCRSVVLEANHDIKMLKEGRYHYSLKERILSGKGHLSNDDSSAAAVHFCRSGTEKIHLAHLSEENNLPEIALSAVESALREAGLSATVSVASPDSVTEV
ncbi:MAG: MBL fold metallo-hydrolase [Clostridia bacterium]|nr:MBL fold metallo-hydrolase [Clostridia bacterium]